MQREFFNLENIMLGGLFLILLIYSGFMMSCTPLQDRFGSDVYSVDRDEDDNNVALTESRRSSRRDHRPCEDRDSCQDSCDYMFRGSSARSECYDLDFDDVSELEHVFDELHANQISKRSLEDIRHDDFENFLEISIDGWLDIILDEEGSDHSGSGHDAYTSNEAKEVLEWIVENDNIARAISRTDDHNNILYNLFSILGSQGSGRSSFTASGTSIEWSSNSNSSNVQFSKGSKSRTLNLSGVSNIQDFVLSFIGSNSSWKFKGDSFISYAEREGSGTTVELAHESLVRFCEDATGDELPDEDVQQCMLAAYCSIYDEENSDNIFEDALSRYRAGARDCDYGVIVEDENDDLDSLF